MDNKPSFLTVNDVNQLIKAKIEGDSFFQNLCIKGEISNWKLYQSGVFFDLKDSKSVISCLLWNDSYYSLPFEPKDGDEVLVRGRLTVYPPRGRYSLSITSMDLFGQGKALLELEALKRKLASEGLFDSSRKREIPRFPQKVAIIVGQGSAAEADLIKNLQRRWPITTILDFPALVQGKMAPKSLLLALKKAVASHADTIIMARGGGSNEDLSAFNDEQLVRAFANSPIPTISAVGHEIDTTLIDYVSDCRVSTPTGAAEKAVPDQADIKSDIMNFEETLSNAIEEKINNLSDKLMDLSSRPFFKNPAFQYEKAAEQTNNYSKRLFLATLVSIQSQEKSLVSLASRLEALSPKKVLKRGFSITEDENGKVISSIKGVAIGATLGTTFNDGIIQSRVIGKEKNGK